jgi:hypothetical protein
MTNETYQEMIVHGIEGLPAEMLAEIADFVYFLRKRALNPKQFEDDLRGVLIHAEMQQMSREEEHHLEGEFADYEKRFPKT